MESAMRPGRTRARGQRGASIVEAVIALPILLVVILGAVQFGLVYEAKATLNHASLQGARLGAVRHADPDAIRRGLARGLVPLYSPDSSLTGIARAITQINTELQTDARIRILNPTREAFDDFGVDVEGEREIPNDRLHTRSTTAGAQSGINIQDANLLKVQITYGYELKVPLVNWFIARVLLGVRRGADSFEQQLLRRTRIPIMSTATVRMQTPARLSDAMISVSDAPDLNRIPADSAPPPTSDEPTEDDEDQQGDGDSSSNDDADDDDDGSGLDEGFFGFGSGRGAEGGGSGSGGGGSGQGGGQNGGNPQSCSAGDPSPFPGPTQPPGDSSPVPTQPGPWFPNGSSTDASLGAISLASLSVGNPIHVLTGNKYQHEIDIDAPPGPLAIGIHRHYNSAAVGESSNVGAGWRLGYDARLHTNSDGSIHVVQGDGRLIRFAATNSAKYVAQRASDGEIAIRDGAYKWTWPSGRSLEFDANGRLINLREANAITRLIYGDDGELLSVRDSHGRELRFEYYANGRIATIRGPAMLGIHYTYDARGNLKYATGTDGVSRRYFYEDLRHPHHLTGIAVGTVKPRSYGERAAFTRLATWAYDEQGRAVFSSHPADAGKVSLTFAATHTDVTDAFGRTTRYMKETRAGIDYVSEVRGPGCGACGYADAAFMYNDRFQPTRITTKTGGTLQYVYDDRDRIVRTERLAASETQVLARFIYEDGSARPARIDRPSIKPNANSTIELNYTRGGLLREVTERGFAPDGQEHRKIERTTQFHYDDHDRLIRIDGPRRDVRDWTDFQHDELGRLTTIKTPSGVQRVEAYDALGRPVLFATDGRPVLRFEYDTHHRITVATQLRSHGQRRIEYRYTDAGQLREVIDSNGRRDRYDFDAAGRPNRFTSSQSDVIAGIRYAADDSIERIAAVGPKGQLLRTLYYAYDAQRRLTEVRDGDGQPLKQLAYVDDDTQPDRATDALRRDTWFGYDAMGQLASVLAPDGGLTQFRRDVAGRLATVQAPNDAKTSYAYDDFGRRVEEKSADRGRLVYRYDEAGNLVAKTDARGLTIRLKYDAANRLIKVTRSEGTTKLAYEHGLLVRVDGEQSSERFFYDADAQLTVHVRVVGGHEFITRFDYDTLGRVVTRTLPSGARLRHRYNDAGLLESITEERWHGDRLVVQSLPSDSRVTGRIDPLGRFAFGNGIETHTTLDASSGRVARRVADGVTTLSYAHDDAGRVRRIVEDGAVRALEYDPNDRLAAVVSNDARYDYRYDVNGNRTYSAKSTVADFIKSDATWNSPTAMRMPLFVNASYLVPRSGARDSHQPFDQAQTYRNEQRIELDDQANRIADSHSSTARAYSYDAAGNAIAIGKYRYEYDSSGRATKLYSNEELIAEYRYNLWGERILKIVHGTQPRLTYFIYEQQKLIAEADDHGNVTREYVYADHHPIAALENGQMNWIHTNHLGTPIAVTNSDRKVIWRAEYEPFGRAYPREDVDNDGRTFVLNLRFPGQYADAESGMHYNYFRDYDPQTGRYLSPDPVGLFDGTNPFAYVHNDPMSGFDSLGLYDAHVHYYMTYFLGLVAGLPEDIARTIALATQYIDENPSTSPTTGWLGLEPNEAALPLYHFVLDYTRSEHGDSQTNLLTRFYEPTSAQLTRLLTLSQRSTLQSLWFESQAGMCPSPGLLDETRYQLFGEYLHAFEDTFAHRDALNAPYDIDSSNDNNWPGAVIGHTGPLVPDRFHAAPDHSFNQDYFNRPSRCELVHQVGRGGQQIEVIEGLTLQQCGIRAGGIL